ncbi:hypothetical protein FKW77_006928 [Venturia effusa]|uniref:Uncharacterized protein n=1 Tax=Venturia effusa TaxID=50376 RepID=A0A517L1J0_9PEZI|nr:hypothetical protein FKW77_006928 [Venturia effusa]
MESASNHAISSPPSVPTSSALPNTQAKTIFGTMAERSLQTIIQASGKLEIGNGPQPWVLDKIADCERHYGEMSDEQRKKLEQREHDRVTDADKFYDTVNPSGGDQAGVFSFLTLEKAQSEMHQRSTTILATWNQLRKVVLSHEVIIRNRWFKKSGIKKRSILVEAFPKISREHNPAFMDYQRACKHRGSDLPQESPCGPQCAPPDCRTTKVSREAALWPHLNVEDLSTQRSLLMLLNARAHHHPKLFAAQDGEVAVSAFDMRAVHQPYLHGHEMHFNDAEGQPYATLEKVNLKTAGIDLELPRGMHGGIGLVVLEIQEKTVSILLRLCEIILHDINPLSICSPSTSIQQDLQPLSAACNQNTMEQVSLRVLGAEAPYQVPSKPNLRHSFIMASARAEAAREHFWAMREDPGYYLEELEVSRVSHGCIGRGHKPLSTWKQIISWTINAALFKVSLWEMVQTSIFTAMTYDSVLSADSSLQDPQDLPLAYLNIIIQTTDVLQTASAWFRVDLTLGVFNSPKIAHLWQEDSYKRGIGLVLKDTRSRDLLAQLLSDISTGSPFAGDRITHHIERVFEADPSQKNRLTPFIWEQLADVEATEAIHLQIRRLCPKLVFPWHAGTLRLCEHRRENANQNLNRQLMEGMREIVKAVKSANLTKYGSPEGRVFDYPAEKASTAKQVLQMQAAERRLDAFWSHVDDVVKEKLGKTFGEWNPALDFSDRTLHRTLDWVPSTQKKGTSSSVSLAGANLAFENSTREDGPVKYLPTTNKEKVKTRGDTTLSQNDGLEDEQAAETEELADGTPTVIKLKQRDFKVFQTLFHQPSQEKLTLGQVKWIDFVHAMAASGFTFPSVGGSVWQFVPQSGLRAINFHEPHPENKIRFTIARCMGRRLSRAYGWTSETFVLED